MLYSSGLFVEERQAGRLSLADALGLSELPDPTTLESSRLLKGNLSNADRLQELNFGAECSDYHRLFY
jgi:hypothetical protein